MLAAVNETPSATNEYASFMTYSFGAQMHHADPVRTRRADVRPTDLRRDRGERHVGQERVAHAELQAALLAARGASAHA